VAQPGNSVGVLCLGGAIGRYVRQGQILNSGTLGAFALALDLTGTPTPTGLVSIAPGEAWNFQAWYRDSVGGAATSNFTSGSRWRPEELRATDHAPNTAMVTGHLARLSQL